MARKTLEKHDVHLHLPKELFLRAEKYRKSKTQTMTTVISIALSRYLDEQEENDLLYEEYMARKKAEKLKEKKKEEKDDHQTS